MASPLVSVLMTAYNREAYIAEAIESVLASTFGDFELIIVDDASQDRTVEIARRYTSDPRVKVYVNDENVGDYPNRNRAASFARGKYLKYLDSDDVIYPYGLEVMVEVMERFPEAALGICRPPSPDGPYPILIQPEQAYRGHFLGRGLLVTGPSGCIIRTDVFHALNGFSGKRFASDTEMWLRITAQCPAVKMMSDLVWWRVHPGQEYRLGLDSLTYFFLNFHIAMEALSSRFCPLSDIERDRAIRRLKYFHARFIWHLALRQRRFCPAFRLYRDSRLSLGELVRGLGRTNGST
jgi:glycosyltransferase involved in cell wall biosynthesis